MMMLTGGMIAAAIIVLTLFVVGIFAFTAKAVRNDD